MKLRSTAPDAALLALSATEVWATRSFGGPVALGFACLGTAALPVRHRFPLAAFAATLPALALGYIWFSPMGALYEIAAGRTGRSPAHTRWPASWRVTARAALTGGCALVAAVVNFVPWPFRDPVSWTLSDTILAVMLSALLAVAPTALGLLAASRRELGGRLDELAASREREHALAADQAVVRERTRLAREMHDTVAHHLSLIAVQSGALEVTAEGPRARAAAGAVRELSRDALDELRRMVGLLRLSVTSGQELAAGPGLAGIPALVAAAGPQTRGELAGLADGQAGDAPPAEVQHAAYRIVQEALTNVRKHAPGARTRVLVRRAGGVLLVEVRNGPGSQAAPAALPSGGHGLAGLRERAVQLGGDFDALPAASGGFLVRATLPVTPATEAA
ncbi:sensor histidine kinase [Actinacidiphila bryophytorum]|uniref:histidine kinase n=1 Tax=Actinacidiphila bryophytorum TaxID=1436133 RepID=A0A9W4E3F6_9ACTN|nr:histidine kinase [Actinacidiphila bryophytorum]MBM9434375.1 two-component sensor histidine kinase [Actinacidiphila bryophytorum]MBN6543588.1 two-component sensor histidine kinase [Actinacidiphila bryophytorum]CAG7625351.1 Histidine kinase [Actinacidiphila bryophytorum]